MPNFIPPVAHFCRRSPSGRRPIQRLPRVCIVDSRAADYRAWETADHCSGAQISIVPSAEAALRLGQRQNIDLWVVNVDLPGLAGTELCGMLKSRDSRTPVYLVADEYSPEAERAAWAARATLFGSKDSISGWLVEWLDRPPCIRRSAS